MVNRGDTTKPVSCDHCGKSNHVKENSWQLVGKTPCEHYGKNNHKSEDCYTKK
jgi:hypothetical protein